MIYNVYSIRYKGTGNIPSTMHFIHISSNPFHNFQWMLQHPVLEKEPQKREVTSLGTHSELWQERMAAPLSLVPERSRAVGCHRLPHAAITLVKTFSRRYLWNFH